MQFKYLLANLGKIHVHDVFMMHIPSWPHVINTVVDWLITLHKQKYQLIDIFDELYLPSIIGLPRTYDKSSTKQ